MIARSAVVVLLLVATGVFGRPAATSEADVARASLTELPRTIGEWSGVDAEPLADDVLAQLGVDDYVNRRYLRSGAPPVAVYIGYYHSQRQGDSIHSPRNCLPGAGWQPIDSGLEVLRTENRDATVNRYVIAKGLDRQVVLYWYQGRGRTVAGEYTNKALLMLDAAKLGRTNGGLVRLVTPVATTTEAATTEVASFATALLPHLSTYLP